jgi:hypothetical protein
MRPTRTADSCALLVVSNITVRVKAKHFSPLSHHDLLWESFTFYIIVADIFQDMLLFTLQKFSISKQQGHF